MVKHQTCRVEAAKVVGTLSQQALEIHARLCQIDRDLLVWQRGNDNRAASHDDPRHRAGRSDGTLPHRSPTRIGSVPGGSSPRLVGTDATSRSRAVAKEYGSATSLRWATSTCVKLLIVGMTSLVEPCKVRGEDRSTVSQSTRAKARAGSQPSRWQTRQHASAGQS